ncbi:LPXTG-motif protein cell wall anchor domain protein [Staphylococcus lugdunensis]|uniref:LPXTG-motif protein cell wall anchor domain protein n=2 Tax=Staphylococcus lugdunensis TaxID=28035 RepID=A0ABD4EG44_STALU|nr:LPXTG-motif protein cell wall anchor domain protein [Staphylococcus lugdunensis]
MMIHLHCKVIYYVNGGFIMKQMVQIILSVFALFLVLTATSVCVTQADTMSQQDAITTAKQAMARSGGNPDLQNFNTVIDKGNYFKIKITLKTNDSVGTYKVYKNGQVEYKNGKFGVYNLLNPNQTYAASEIANTSTHMAQQEQQNNPVDCKKELNRYYVGNIKSTELPQQNASLPETGHTSNNIITLAFGILALMSGLALTFMRNSKH